MRVQVCIIGGGPSGLLLGLLLNRAGIDVTILERRTRAYVLARIRAGVLENNTCDLLRKAGVGERLDRQGFVHDGTAIASNGRAFRIDFKALTASTVTVYGQTEVTHDLYDAHDVAGTSIIHEAEDIAIHDADTDRPFVTYRHDGGERRIDCDYVAGCDGYHGVSRRTIPARVRREFERVYPFGWLGILSETPPVDEELIYAQHERGFALCSMRNENLSRYYVQVPVDEPLDAWDDARFWDELKRRIPDAAADKLVTGASIEKSIAPLRNFICEPMRWGRLFLVGDAAHIVPPTGAKGLNLAASDVHYLSQALIARYEAKDDAGIEAYSAKALARVWKCSRFSWWMTTMLHSFDDEDDFARRMRETELDYLERSKVAQTSLAENYIGLPY